MDRPARSRHAIIILNYKRPQNIAPIVRRCLASRRQPDIFVIDNAPDLSARTMCDAYPTVDYRPQERNWGCGRRYAVSLTLPHDITLCIDDDVFLSAVQIDALFDRVEQQPDRVHGVWSEGFVFRDGVPSFISGLAQRDVEVPVINRVYGYSKAYLADATRTAAKIGIVDWNEVPHCDDLLLSLSGGVVPLCHALGPFGECPTSNTAGIAAWKEAAFSDDRVAFLLRLLPVIAHDAHRLEAMTRHMWRQPKKAFPAAAALPSPS